MLQHLLLLIVLSLTTLTAGAADEKSQDRRWKLARIDWSGTWTADPQFERLLGIVRKADEGAPPKELTLKPVDDVDRALNSDSIRRTQKEYFDRLRHSIVDSGTWSAPAEFRVRTKRDSKYFITHREGETWLWLGTPAQSFSGAKIQLIRGVSAQQDLLILNFDVLRAAPRKFADAVGYRRSARSPQATQD